jgi:PAS domain S-box-containing protein
MAAANRPGSISGQDLEAILDSLFEGLVIVDGEGSVLRINRAACEFLEVAKDSATGADSRALFGELFGHAALEILGPLQENRPVKDGRIRTRTRSGREKVLAFHTAVLPDSPGPPRRTIVLIRDVTELVKLKELARGRQHEAEPAMPVKRAIPRIPAGAESSPTPEITTPESIRRALDDVEWNVARAARQMGVSRTTLYKRIRQLGLKRPGVS